MEVPVSIARVGLFEDRIGDGLEYCDGLIESDEWTGYFSFITERVSGSVYGPDGCKLTKYWA
jgi:hypothetical protein